MVESVENSPIALAIASVIVLIAQSILYARQRNAVDIEKRDRGVFGPRVDQALREATDAKNKVETIELDHYKKLAAMFANCCSELEAAKVKIRSLEESISSLSNKLASRDRADKAAEKRAAKADPADDDTVEPPVQPGPGGLTAEQLAAMGAIPLLQQHAAPAAPRRAPDFGRVA